MIYFLLVFLETGLLFILSRIVSKTLSRFLSIQALSFLFLPGVIIHELSHLLTAGIMLVPVGEIEFMPKLISGGVKLGSVAIGKTDPVRRAIIGFAPVLAGLGIIFGIVYYLMPFSSFWGGTTPESVFGRFWIFDQNDGLGGKLLLSLIIVYFLFAISNTMFSSSRDMEGTLEITIALLIISGALYFTGFRPDPKFLNIIFSEQVVDLFKTASLFLLAPIGIDLGILGAIKIVKNSK